MYIFYYFIYSLSVNNLVAKYLNICFCTLYTWKGHSSNWIGIKATVVYTYYILYHENIWLCGILRIIICALTRFNWYCFCRGADVVTASIRYRIIIHGFLGRTRMFCITWICGIEILLWIYSLKFFLMHE